MANDDDKPAPANDPFAHLIPRDPRAPEEKEAAEGKERARRRGRRTKEWWKAPDPSDNCRTISDHAPETKTPREG